MRVDERGLRQGLEVAPRMALILSSLGHVLNEQNRCDEAVDLFCRATEVAPQEATHLVGLGYAYSELGLVEESIAAYRRAAELSNVPLFRILATTQLPLVYESRDDILRWRKRLISEVDALIAEG